MDTTEKRAIRFSLRVYRDLREKMLEDTINKKTDLYLGLHGNKDSVREIYLERYKLMWLLDHLDYFEKIIGKNVSIEKGTYRNAFTKGYAQFLKENGQLCGEEFITDQLLKNYQATLEEMIDTSLSWEQGYEKLRLEKIKFDEKYQEFVEEK